MHLVTADDKRPFGSIDWVELSPRMLMFARFWARQLYGWEEGKCLPEGNQPKDIVGQVIYEFSIGQRTFNDRNPVFTQIKGAIRSILSNLHSKKSSRITDAIDPAILDEQIGVIPDPATEAITTDNKKRFFEVLYSVVEEDDELWPVILAYEDGCETLDEVAKHTRIPKPKLYELRRKFKRYQPIVMAKLSKGD